MYELLLKINLENDSTVFGTSKIIMNDGRFVEFNIEGKIKGDSIFLEDVAVINEKGSNAQWMWCVKAYSAKIVQINGQWILEGPWLNPGNISYSTGDYLQDKFVCQPGKFRAARQKEALNSNGEKKRFFQRREVEVQKILEVESDSVEIAFFDNNVIDDDTLSVFYNEELIVRRHRLSADSLKLTLPVIDGKDNEIVIFAHNVGSIPPNTAAVCIISNGRKEELSINCDTRKNAAIIIRRRQ